MTTTLSTAGQTGTESSRRHLGVALFVIATAQLMIVLDATIVYVALPHIQAALGFSGSGLEWVANAYALTFGGLLLLGGRAGDLLGRRRMFIIGLLLFSAASLAGGLATSPAWLLAARAVQGAGGAIVAPTALALIATTFPEGPPRSRAMGVYAAMSVAGELGRAARRGAARHVRRLALGAVRQRADRHRGRARRLGSCCARGCAPAGRARPARHDHRNGGSGGARLRPVQRRHQPGRGVALGRRQGGGRAGGSARAARGVRGDRGAQPPRAAAGAAAAQPGPGSART